MKDKTWPKTSIDHFVLARLEAQGLKPLPAADKRTWIRRVTFDLIGLPPTPEEVEAFIKDSSTKARAKVVDRLLASPRYGERWGRHWLDVARYSDDLLNTLKEDPLPNAFRYRDWVINAFNEDLPYDQFVKAQIAGDFLDGDKGKWVGGLGFYNLTPNLQDDRVDVTTRGFLGLTAACAQCHDHKFDPIPTKDFYALQGIFESTEIDEYPLAPAGIVENTRSRRNSWMNKNPESMSFWMPRVRSFLRFLRLERRTISWQVERSWEVRSSARRLWPKMKSSTGKHSTVG